MYITPSPFGKNIHNLERELGVKLFERKNNSLKLTPKGGALYQKIKSLDLFFTSLENDLCPPLWNNKIVHLECDDYFYGKNAFLGEYFHNKIISMRRCSGNHLGFVERITTGSVDAFILSGSYIQTPEVDYMKIATKKVCLIMTDSIFHKNKNITNILNNKPIILESFNESHPLSILYMKVLSRLDIMFKVIFMPEKKGRYDLLLAGSGVMIVAEDVYLGIKDKNPQIIKIKLPTDLSEIDFFIHYHKANKLFRTNEKHPNR